MIMYGPAYRLPGTTQSRICYSGTTPPELGGYCGLDYSGHCGFIRSDLGHRLKYSHGFTRLTPSVITLVAMAASVFLLAYAMKTLPAGTAYAVWTGIGAVGTAILGIALLGESASLARVFSLGLILAGIIGLKLAS